ncbi:DMT family transporter [Brevibacillus migulae]|uniref:DMT family transporter n=1 Tax=Brevibacillus migulae TaxID=1644114 RepID=UPI00106E66E5|nr:DMT family transporter [Brevibacillus migulae]
MKQTKIYIMLLSVSIFMGAAFPLAKYTVDYFSPASAAAWRFGIAAAVMLIMMLATEGIQKHQIKRNIVWFTMMGIVGVFGFNALFFAGMKSTSSVNGALIMALNPLITTMLARVLLKDRISKQQGVGIFLAFIGVSLVITQGSLQTIATLSISGGDAMILAGNLCWALYGVLGRRFVKDATPLATTTYTMVIGALALIMSSVYSSNPVPMTDVPLQAWAAILFMALFTSVLGYLWWNQGMKLIGASKTSLFFNLVPVVVMIISLAAGTPVTLIQVLGAAIVIIGVFTSSGLLSGQWREKRAVRIRL